MIVILNQTFILPRFDLYRPQAELAHRINARVPEGAPICLVEIPSPQIVFYLRYPMKRFDNQEDFARWLDREPAGKPVYVVGPRLVAEKVQPLGRSETLDQANALTRITLMELRPNPAPVAEGQRLRK